MSVAIPSSNPLDIAISDILRATQKTEQVLSILWNNLQSEFLAAGISDPFPVFIQRVIPRFDLITILRAVFAAQWTRIHQKGKGEASRRRAAAARLGLQEDFELFLWFGSSVNSDRCWKLLSKQHLSPFPARELFTELEQSLVRRGIARHHLTDGFQPRDFAEALKSIADRQAASQGQGLPALPSPSHTRTHPEDTNNDKKLDGRTEEQAEAVIEGDKTPKDGFEDSGISLDDEQPERTQEDSESVIEDSAIILDDTDFGLGEKEDGQDTHNDSDLAVEGEGEESSGSSADRDDRKDSHKPQNDNNQPTNKSTEFGVMVPSQATPLSSKQLPSQHHTTRGTTGTNAEGTDFVIEMGKSTSTLAAAKTRIDKAQQRWRQEEALQGSLVNQYRNEINLQIDKMDDDQSEFEELNGVDAAAGDACFAEYEGKLRRVTTKKRKAANEVKCLEVKKQKLDASMRRMLKEVQESMRRHEERVEEELKDVSDCDQGTAE